MIMVESFWCHFRQTPWLKNRLRYAVFFFCYIFLPTAAHSEISQFVMYPTSAKYTHAYSLPYSGRFTAINGDKFDASEYFKSSNLELSISGFSAIFFENNLSIKLNWLLDIGYNSALYNVQPSLLGGVGLIKSNPGSKFEIVLNNLFFLGGELSERACVDVLEREFHCGSGLPWSDYVPYEITPDVEVLVNWTFYF
jgi:hypothetical protein